MDSKKLLEALDQGLKTTAIVRGRVSSYKLGKTRREDPMVTMNLSDETTTIKAVAWRESAELVDLHVNDGDEIETSAVIDIYQGTPQLLLQWNSHSRKLPTGTVGYPRFEIDIDEAKQWLSDIVDNLRDPLRMIACYCFDEKRLAEFLRIHAAVEGGHHHGKIHGLFVHTREMIDTTAALSGAFGCDRDLAVLCTLLHDYGKMFTYEIGKKLDVRPEEAMIGHLYLGAIEISKALHRLRQTDFSIPELLEREIVHAVICHFGRFMTRQEAIHEDGVDILHLLDLPAQDIADDEAFDGAGIPDVMNDLLQELVGTTIRLIDAADPGDIVFRENEGQGWLGYVAHTNRNIELLSLVSSLHDPSLAFAIVSLINLKKFSHKLKYPTGSLLLPEEELCLYVARAIADMEIRGISIPYHEELAIYATILASQHDINRADHDPHLPKTPVAKLVHFTDFSSAQHEKCRQARGQHPEESVVDLGYKKPYLLGGEFVKKDI